MKKFHEPNKIIAIILKSQLQPLVIFNNHALSRLLEGDKTTQKPVYFSAWS